MIHELIKLDRPLIIFDLETTSLLTDEARIVELGFQHFTHEGLTKEYRTLVNPCVPIPSETTAKHTITDADVTVHCSRCKALEVEHPSSTCEQFYRVPKFIDIAQRLALGFSDADFGGKNIRYDLQVLSAEMKRAKVAWSYAGARILDADRFEQIGEPRTLSNLYTKHTGKTLDNAHQALADVRATTEVLVSQLQKYAVLPRTLSELHELQWPGWIDSEGKFRFDRAGVPVCQFGKHRGSPMKVIPLPYWQFIIREQFGEEIKTLARDAISRKFPQRRSTD